MKFIATTYMRLILIIGSYVSADSSSLPNISGESKINEVKDKWIPHPTDISRRRLQLSSADDCLLVKKVIDYEDHDLDEDVWSCEFSHAYAKEYFKGQIFLDIKMMKMSANGKYKVMGSQTMNNAVGEFKPVSGESILHTSDAFVEESLNSNVMVLYIPENGKFGVELINDDHSRHHKQRRMNRQRELRSLADSRAGELSVLVVRVVDNNGSSGSSEVQLKDDIFDDSFSLKTGYAQCSKNQLIMTPATGNNVLIQNGIVTINIGISASAGTNALEMSAFAAAQAELGDLSSQWDLVMFCQPPSGSWLAYAYINSWASYYNGRWCNSVSAQMHEVGHNLGLGHSNEPSVNYGDQSCLMGYSYDIDDGPKMCFNAAKNYQLGWYDRQKAEINPLLNQNTALDFVFNGVELFEPDGDNRSTECGTKSLAYSDYRGTIATTINGRTCQRWDDQSPHSHSYIEQDYPNSGLEENYCRNAFSNGDQAWCYTTDSTQRWEYCEVPDCDTIEESNDRKLITLRIIEYGDSGSRDYYVGFNDAFGVNSGTLEGRNQVLIFRKDAGGPNGYGESYRIAALDVGNSITIPNFRGVQNVDVTIKFNSLTNGGRDANVEIVISGDNPTPPPTLQPTKRPTQPPTKDFSTVCNGLGRFQFELTMDDYASETAWKLIDNDTNSIIEDVPTSSSNRNGQTYLYPRDDFNVQTDATDDFYCLQDGKCYTMIVTDSYGDGMTYGDGGFYTGYLDLETKFVGDGSFTSESRHVFCVGISETEPPTPPPTPPPTLLPTPPPSPLVIVPTPQPFNDVGDDCDGMGRFQFELTMDDYASETAWKLIDNDTNSTIEDVPTSSNNLNGQTYLYPRDDFNVQTDATDDFYCLQDGKCYTMIVTDSYGDGMTYGDGGFYTGYLDLEIQFVGDGSFTTEISHIFCVGVSESEPPTPTPLLTPPPTSLLTPPPSPSVVVPTPQPFNDVGDDCDGMGRFKFELTMDDYASETAWILIDNDTDSAIEDVPSSDDNRNGQMYLYPKDDMNVQIDATDEYYCLQREKCYTMVVTDSYGDGMTYGDGGFYTGYLDDATIFFGDGSFTTESRHVFCVGILETEPPSSIEDPTFYPTISGTTPYPTFFPTEISSNANPIASPTVSPTESPTTSPTAFPTASPTFSPTASPTALPTESPTASPTKLPTKSPTKNPTSSPTIAPTKGLSCEDLQSSGIVKNNPVQRCVWISLFEGSEDDCPKLCKVCAGDSSAPVCEDDKKYKYNGKKKKYCKKLSNFSASKKKRFCKKKDSVTKQKIKDYCPKTCGECS